MRILAVSPHPDDVEYGIGGILLRAKENQHEITILCNEKMDVIDHPSPDIVEQRKKEALNVADFWQIKYEFFSLNDGLNSIADCIRRIQPQIILLPYFNDFNPIHRETTVVFKDAIFSAQTSTQTYSGLLVSQLFYYETYSTEDFKPDFIIDVTAQYTYARKALKLHTTGIKTLPSLEYKFQLMHQQRGLEGSCHYGEGILRANEYWFNWCMNQKTGIDFLLSLME